MKNRIISIVCVLLFLLSVSAVFAGCENFEPNGIRLRGSMITVSWFSIIPTVPSKIWAQSWVLTAKTV